MRLRIEFDTDNAAFVDAPIDEVRRVLMKVVQMASAGILSDGQPHDLYDANGNAVGNVQWSELEIVP